MKNLKNMLLLSLTALTINACQKNASSLAHNPNDTKSMKKTRAGGFYVLSKPNSAGVAQLLFCANTNNVTIPPFNNPGVITSYPITNALRPTGMAYRTQITPTNEAQWYFLHKPSPTANWRISVFKKPANGSTVPSPLACTQHSNINNSANLVLADLEYDPYYNGPGGAGQRFVILDKTIPNQNRIISVPIGAGNFTFNFGNPFNLSGITTYDPQGLAVVTSGTQTTSYEVFDSESYNTNNKPTLIHISKTTLNATGTNTLTTSPFVFGTGCSIVFDRYLGNNKMYFMGATNSFNSGNTTSVAGPWQSLLGGYAIEDLATQE
jgi:hypothetical protein